MRITKHNFIVPVKDDSGCEFSVFVPHPNDLEISRISRVLSYIYKEIRTSGVIGVIVDYERLIDEALMSMPSDYRTNVKEAVETFFSRCETGAKMSDGRDFVTLKAEEKEAFRDVFRGTLLFISALWRYFFTENPPKGADDEVIETINSLRPYFTLQTATEWLKCSASVSAESAELATEATAVETVKVSPMS